MRILDKTASKAPWAQMTPEQRDRLTSAGNLAPWMFQQSVVLTVVDEVGNVKQLDGVLPPAGEIELTAKPTFGERVRAIFTRGEGDE